MGNKNVPNNSYYREPKPSSNIDRSKFNGDYYRNLTSAQNWNSKRDLEKSLYDKRDDYYDEPQSENIKTLEFIICKKNGRSKEKYSVNGTSTADHICGENCLKCYKKKIDISQIDDNQTLSESNWEPIEPYRKFNEKDQVFSETSPDYDRLRKRPDEFSDTSVDYYHDTESDLIDVSKSRRPTNDNSFDRLRNVQEGGADDEISPDMDSDDIETDDINTETDVIDSENDGDIFDSDFEEDLDEQDFGNDEPITDIDTEELYAIQSRMFKSETEDDESEDESDDEDMDDTLDSDLLDTTTELDDKDHIYDTEDQEILEMDTTEEMRRPTRSHKNYNKSRNVRR